VTLEPSEALPNGDASPSGGAAPPAPGRGPSREYRASVAFTIGGAAILFVVLLVSGSILNPSPPIRGVVLLAGVILGVAALLGTAYGLSRGSGWAVAAATPMLWVLVVAGITETVVAATHSTINIPIGALLAVWALRAPVRSGSEAGRSSPALGVAGALALGAMLLSAGWPLVSPILLQSGGPFVVGADALQPTLTLNCDGVPVTAPTAVSVEYDWRWLRSEPWAAGNDSITLAAYTTREADTGSFTIDADAPGSVGTWQSDFFILEPQGIVFGVDLAQAGFNPGSVGFGLIAPGVDYASPHGSIQLMATYLHAPADTNGPDSPAAWRVTTEARCEW